MLTTMFPFLDPATLSRELAERLRTLSDDVERIDRFGSVSMIALHTAPRIDDWTVVRTALGIRLVGRMTGHPLLGDRTATTSPLWFADPDGAWVRTLSRFYRLGMPLSRQQLDELFALVEAQTASNAGNDRKDRT